MHAVAHAVGRQRREERAADLLLAGHVCWEARMCTKGQEAESGVIQMMGRPDDSTSARASILRTFEVQGLGRVHEPLEVLLKVENAAVVDPQALPAGVAPLGRNTYVQERRIISTCPTPATVPLN